MSAVVYGFRAADKSWLYIGCTQYLERPLGGHLAKPWWPEAASTHILAGPVNLVTAQRLERHLIETLEPKHNSTFSAAWREANGARLIQLEDSERKILAAGWTAPVDEQAAFHARADHLRTLRRRMYPEAHAAYETPRRGGDAASPPPADAGRRPDADTNSP